MLIINHTKETKSCLICSHSTWAVGIGQGFFCRNEEKINQGVDRVLVSSIGFKRFMIPNRGYICEFFESKSCSPHPKENDCIINKKVLFKNNFIAEKHVNKSIN